MPANNIKPDRVLQGIILIIASVFAMAFSDAVIKLISNDLTVWQILISRSLFAALCLIAFAYVSNNTIKPRIARWVVIRSTLIALAWLVYYAAFPVVELSVAAVAIYTNPIITVLLSAAVIKERVSWRQWCGVFIGFVGVIIILKPGSDSFTWFIILPLLGAALYSAAMVLTRSKCQNESATTLAFGLHSALIITGLIAIGTLSVIEIDVSAKSNYPFLLEAWMVMGLKEWGLMAFLGALFAAFSMGVARAYQIAPPQIIATFDYTYLVAITIWGFVLFSKTPDLLTIVGMILITVAGLLVSKKSSEKTK